MNINQKEQYIAIPIWLIKLTSNKKSPIFLTPFQRDLFCLIRGLCNNKKNQFDPKPCYAKDDYFVKIFNVSINHINRTIKLLKTLKLISIVNETNQRLIYCPYLDKGSVFLNKNDVGDFILTTEHNVYKIPHELSEQERETVFENIRNNTKEIQQYVLK
ncbi:hypothetical protein DFQ11_101931 [Winogradskyella epiphytica]|uniref:Uncharacterized protein n=1 Tax=Winogradskyella epiphytica TaxID=262005 RepID=A0A2V4XBS9_9FLAO|nr:hypothetical protein [Winogradskyella epiphytica]PYE83495.1 hypothetical protein DFQ11_101931 [Winogradskyella epiphytica]GGW58595.1 hypothetical protein GCM10008085_07880 [Winogradskyella epiphytica]